MNSLIEPTLKSLKKAEVILFNLTDEQLSNTSIPPYFSSIGKHVRHILDFYDCIFKLRNNKIDLTTRSRNPLVEQHCSDAINYLYELNNKLRNFRVNTNQEIIVVDNLGEGNIEIPYTIGALLAQANSHTIHHYAIINYILNGMKISINDLEFGYNATTPRA
ncbi:DinB family protein [Aestuariibaculum sp. TT11]|uniref:DinB family protein n=2 Tax=Aestuariibaculum sediminum TaxID=2770637 RepID=A0A8J6QCE7_9FLAO|nr:DinB family protein [Aestuariibaculum sediminum]